MTDIEELRLFEAMLARLAATFDAAELSKALDDFGYDDLLRESQQVAVSGLFRAMGRAGSNCCALSRVMVASLAETGGVNVPPASSMVIPLPGKRFGGSLDGDRIHVRGLVVGGFDGRALVALATTDGAALALVQSGGGVIARSVSGIDPDAQLTHLEGTEPSGRIVLDGPDAVESWRAAVSAGQRALSYQLVGGVAEMIDLAVAHARERVQFGRPIGTFQAVRHRLADAHVAWQGAEAAAEISWEADDPGLAAILAKSLAGGAARVAARHCQQVLAGTGFTADHPLHRYLHRALLLDRLLGSSTELPRQIGAQLVAARAVPRLVQL